MKIIFLHGLGQDGTSWERTAAAFGDGFEVFCPNLADWLSGKTVCYENLYRALEEYCELFDEPFCLCGLSLGGVLALQYGIAHGDRVSALVLIGTPYVMPKRLLQVQNALFRIMPNAAFRGMGFGKAEVIGLSKSMMCLDFRADLQKLTCRTLVVCGEKDRANRRAASELQERISGAQIAVIPQAGHEVNRERPEMLGEVLRTFFGNAGGF